MALRVWLPLNGQFENQGLLGPLTQTAAPTYVDGKFGKALASGGCSMTAEQTASVLNNEAVSICFWVYINADTGTTPTDTNMFFGNNSPRRFSLFAYQTVNDLHCSWENDVGSFLIASVDKGVLPSYTWTHVAVTYQNPEIKIYINGKCIRTHSGVSNVDFNYATQVIHNVTWRYFNDFRIYDHCLSPREIKEITKGLVLHYPLNGGEGGINLFKNELAYYSTSSGHSYIGTTPVFDTDLMPLNSLIGKTITFTFDYSIEGDKLNTSGSWQTMRYGAHLTVNYTNSAGVSETAYPCAGSLHESPTPEGTGHSAQTYTFPSDWQSIEYFGISVQPQNRPAANNSATWYIKNFKLELGDADTGYSVNPNTLGVATEITDCSGFGNNGTRSSILAHNSNSAKYDASTYFDGAQYICAGRGAMVTDAITVSMWGYMDNWNDYGNMISCTQNGGWNFERSGSNTLQFVLFRNGAYIAAAETVALSSYTAGWHHFVGTYDGSTIALYVDGVLKRSTKVEGKYPIGYNATNGIFIGAEAGDNPTTPDPGYFKGLLSDVRIYATALSIDDIKELYSTAASLDKAGNMYAYEFKEV